MAIGSHAAALLRSPPAIFFQNGAEGTHIAHGNQFNFSSTICQNAVSHLKIEGKVNPCFNFLVNIRENDQLLSRNFIFSVNQGIRLRRFHTSHLSRRTDCGSSLLILAIHKAPTYSIVLGFGYHIILCSVKSFHCSCNGFANLWFTRFYTDSFFLFYHVLISHT